MRDKYDMETLNKKYAPLDIFRYIGKDYEGRPVIFFKSFKYIPDQLDDIKEYLDYNAFLLELFSQDQMEGYIDEYIVIADYTNFGKANFQYAAAKDFSETGN
jgi:hypothetical protein